MDVEPWDAYVVKLCIMEGRNKKGASKKMLLR